LLVAGGVERGGCLNAKTPAAQRLCAPAVKFIAAKGYRILPLSPTAAPAPDATHGRRKTRCAAPTALL